MEEDQAVRSRDNRLRTPPIFPEEATLLLTGELVRLFHIGADPLCQGFADSQYSTKKSRLEQKISRLLFREFSNFFLIAFIDVSLLKLRAAPDKQYLSY